MSRIGNKIINIPLGVNVEIKNSTVIVEGSKGKIIREFRNDIEFLKKNNQIYVNRKSDESFYKALHGLYRSLVFNMVKGVSDGFKKKLILNGVGYRVKLEKTSLIFSLGYSHPIMLNIPDIIKVEILDNGKTLILRSFDKEFLGNFSAKIRSYRPPEPYKKKGIQYDNEIIQQKAGKSSKK